MNTMFRLSIVVLLSVTFAGCGTTSTINSPTPIIPHPSLSKLEGEKHLPTFTPRPSSTPVSSKTPDLTETAYAQDRISAKSTEQALVSQYPHACELLYASREFSPNRLWMAELCYSDADKDLMLTFSSNEKQVLWKVFYKDFIPQMDSMPDGGLSVVHWSNDGRYAYFYSYLGGDGGECYVGNETSGSGLFRIDLETGYVTDILPKKDIRTWYTFSFSPTDRRLVYGISSVNLQILDISTGKLIGVVNVNKFSQSGKYVWSPDGLKFVYSTVSYNELAEPVSYSLRLADAQSGSERILLESPESCFSTKSWTEDKILEIESYDKNYDQTLIKFDLNSNSVISESTTTP